MLQLCSLTKQHTIDVFKGCYNTDGPTYIIHGCWALICRVGENSFHLRPVASVPRAINGISKNLGGYSLCKSDRNLLKNTSGVRHVCGNTYGTFNAVFHPS